MDFIFAPAGIVYTPRACKNQVRSSTLMKCTIIVIIIAIVIVIVIVIVLVLLIVIVIVIIIMVMVALQSPVASRVAT